MHLGCSTTLAIGSNSRGSGVCATSLRRPAASDTTTANATGMCMVFSSSRADVVWLQRQLPNPLPSRCEDRVGHGGNHNRRARLPNAPRRLLVSHQVDLDRRRFVHPQDPVVVEIGLLDPPALERDL